MRAVRTSPLLAKLSKKDCRLIRRCLKASCKGKFFPDWEFQTIFGVDRQTVEAVYQAWPVQTLDDETFRQAIIASMNNLSGYPHSREAELLRYVPEGRQAVTQTLARIIRLFALDRNS
jgi:hypothetical protein